MKMKTNHKLSILTFLLSFSLYFGQKVEFNIPKDIQTLQNSIFNFKNDFTRDEAKAAAASDTDFSTTVELYDLKYEGSQKNPYLDLALKTGAKSKQFIQQAVWNVNMKKVSSKSTKITVFLEKVVPDSWSKKEVDTKLTKSTGKLEKEIKEFLLNHKPAEHSNDLAAVDASFTDEETEAQATAQVAAFEAKTTQKKTVSKNYKVYLVKNNLSHYLLPQELSQNFYRPVQVNWNAKTVKAGNIPTGILKILI
ncbi:hypothetical protein EG345_03590 [Chryseobacterium carnipullorum]|uniref:hypothetical protein n=1 Tax=Chryseobacterium carnipullorum TaxID=1124835 RepID=UPI000F4FFC39|nr:hypothetical protein [Chryseobacterium carnipullorum]AZA63870.1 hypothetical protein EG345_03590 [Chryseobacterium carnipullorum]